MNKLISGIENGLSQMVQTILSIIRIVISSKFIKNQMDQGEMNDIVILGNGPSLKELITTKYDFLKGKDLIAVNYAVLSDDYNILKPQYYVLADPAFFFNPDHRNKVFDNLCQKTDWNMTLFIPTFAQKSDEWKMKLKTCPNINCYFFNMNPIEGFTFFTHWAYRNKWGMPRPRNVLIPAIMLALQLKGKNIYIAGADHSWLKDIWIDESNHLHENFKHFYSQESASKYSSDYHLHNMLYNLYITFKSYHIIEKYAKTIGKRIINITDGSYIDAFQREKI